MTKAKRTASDETDTYEDGGSVVNELPDHDNFPVHEVVGSDADEDSFISGVTHDPFFRNMSAEFDEDVAPASARSRPKRRASRPRHRMQQQHRQQQHRQQQHRQQQEREPRQDRRPRQERRPRETKTAATTSDSQQRQPARQQQQHASRQQAQPVSPKPSGSQHRRHPHARRRPSSKNPKSREISDSPSQTKRKPERRQSRERQQLESAAEAAATETPPGRRSRQIQYQQLTQKIEEQQQGGELSSPKKVSPKSSPKKLSPKSFKPKAKYPASQRRRSYTSHSRTSHSHAATYTTSSITSGSEEEDTEYHDDDDNNKQYYYGVMHRQGTRGSDISLIKECSSNEDSISVFGLTDRHKDKGKEEERSLQQSVQPSVSDNDESMNSTQIERMIVSAAGMGNLHADDEFQACNDSISVIHSPDNGKDSFRSERLSQSLMPARQSDSEEEEKEEELGVDRFLDEPIDFTLDGNNSYNAKNEQESDGINRHSTRSNKIPNSPMKSPTKSPSKKSPKTPSKSPIKGPGKISTRKLSFDEAGIQAQKSSRVNSNRLLFSSRKVFSGSGRNFIVTDDTPIIDFLDDKKEEMTYGRQIALYLMTKFTWYYPQLKEARERSRRMLTSSDRTTDSDTLNDDATHQFRSNDGYIRSHSTRERVCLASAWAYFEHYTLGRYVVDKSQQEDKRLTRTRWQRIKHRFEKANQPLERAQRGENVLPTRLYHWLWTPHTQLGDFGIGWGLYFASLRAFAVIMFLAGLLNVPNFLYYGSDDYAGDQAGTLQFLLQGSAICTETEWVPCPDCHTASLTQNRWGQDIRYIQESRLANYTDPVTYRNMTFALRNFCNGATREQGLINYGSLILILMGLVLFNRYVQIMEVLYDEDEQTAQDYSIQIENPPEDATDPDEWIQFFRKTFDAQVAFCTVVVNNDTLIKKLVKRRECLRKIERMVPEGTPMDTVSLAGVVAKNERERSYLSKLLSFVIPGIPELFRSVVVLTTDIRGLAQEVYPATKVFVTFEKEYDQRRVLSELAVGSLHVWRKDHTKLKKPSFRFRDEHMLDVSESDEPDTMRWNHMNESEWNKVWQVSLTTIGTLLAVVAAAQAVEYVNGLHPYASALAISIFNSGFPYCAKALTRLEGHRTETEVQTSMYCKIVVFRWVNTAIVYTLIKPFTATISANDGLIEAVYALFFSEIITLNAIQLSDPYGNFLRHVVAPRARTQDEMNICFRGLEVELAERYTNMTKIVFLACWYSSIYPGGFFMSSIALFVNYYTDRHSLMRTWYRAPHLGPQISEFSRKYFLTMCFMAMAVLSAYFWSGFPFDNLCESEEKYVDVQYVGTNLAIYPNLGKDEKPQYVNVTANDRAYRYCNQDFFRLRVDRAIFPYMSRAQPHGDEWMTPEQELLADLYGWTVICVVSFVCVCFLQAFCDSIMKMLYGDANAVGHDMGQKFSSLRTISGYIPQVDSQVYPYPLIVGTIDSNSMRLIDWTDPLRPHSYYDLTKDAEKILRDIDNSKVFSQVKAGRRVLSRSKMSMKGASIG